MYVVGDKDAPSDYVLHTANILAQYLDNDEDGIPKPSVITIKGNLLDKLNRLSQEGD